MIDSVEQFVKQVKKDHGAWKTETFPWFRGEKASPDGKPRNRLLPKLFWTKPDGKPHDENQLLQNFRQRAPTLAEGMQVPPRSGHTDQWLFLAQHMNLPTRLLDWTEGALIALYFALQEGLPREGRPTVWMLDPIKLNGRSGAELDANEFPLTWVERRYQVIVPGDQYSRIETKFGPSIGNDNIRRAWEYPTAKEKRPGVDLPVAVHPTNIHPRLAAQKSCFTVHGKREQSIALLAPEFLTEYVIDHLAESLC